MSLPPTGLQMATTLALTGGSTRLPAPLSLGVRWDGGAGRRARVPVVLAAAALFAAALPLTGLTARLNLVDVIVRGHPGGQAAAIELVRSVGGQVERRIDLIDGVEARLPVDAVGRAAASRAVHSVTPDGTVRMLGTGSEAGGEGAMSRVRESIGAEDYWRAGFTGQGIDVALIDTGVAPVDGLTRPDKVIYGPDLSPESQVPELRFQDTLGHGTHMAGIIAGRDDAVRSVTDPGSDQFLGVAPNARIVSVKVADANGLTDVSQVIAAIDWVVKHRTDHGMDIRVLNLSFGTDSAQDYRLDPLAYAAEVAWRKGIVVVVAAGNDGFGPLGVNNPATDPYVIAVGAADTRGTYPVSDDSVPSFSTRGVGERNPDLVAPGKSVVSLRVPGSHVDLEYDEGRVGSRFFRGSGTSQATAVVSGAAALIIDQRPSVRPDQVKRLLMLSSRRLSGPETRAQGSGVISLRGAFTRATPAYTQNWERSTGNGSLEAARGSQHLIMNGRELRGEKDIFGAAFVASDWAPNMLALTSWSGGSWNGNRWSGSEWNGDRWEAATWTADSWSGNRWSSDNWSGNRWSNDQWSSSSWS